MVDGAIDDVYAIQVEGDEDEEDDDDVKLVGAGDDETRVRDSCLSTLLHAFTLEAMLELLMISSPLRWPLVEPLLLPIISEGTIDEVAVEAAIR